MTAYIIRRILWGIVLLFLISALTFLFFYVFPAANPAVLRTGRNASPHTIAYISKELGLDEPVYTQFYDYMKGINLHFNFGYHYSGTSVLSLIFNRLPATLSLTVGAVVLWVVVGIPIGIISAIKRGKFLTARRWEPRSSSCRCPCSGSGCCCCSCSLRTSVGFRSCRAQAHTSD